MVSFPQLFNAKDRNFSGQKKGCIVQMVERIKSREKRKATQRGKKSELFEKVQISAYAHAPK